jgi:hypothetical protein
MRQRLRDTVWWPGINADVDSYVKNCEACHFSDKSARPVLALLHSIPFFFDTVKYCRIRHQIGAARYCFAMAISDCRLRSVFEVPQSSCGQHSYFLVCYSISLGFILAMGTAAAHHHWQRQAVSLKAAQRLPMFARSFTLATSSLPFSSERRSWTF